MRTRLVLVVALALAFLLGACASPTVPIDTSYSVDGTVHTDQFDPDLVPLGVSLFVIDDGAFPSAAAHLSGFIEAAENIFISPIASVDEDGSFVLVFPDGEDVPASSLAAAANFVVNARTIVGCTVVASDTSANVSAAAWQLISVPGIVAYFLEGAAVTLISADELDFDDPALTFYDIEYVTWVYADSAVDVSTGAGCVDGGVEIDVDVSLQAGWNQLSWTATEGEDMDPDVLMLRNGNVDEVHVYVGFGFF